LDVIASVVMGGTMLSGGAGYVFGTFFGVLVLAVTQTLIQFIGTLSSWWTKIVIGVLTLAFIGVQTVLANRKSGRQSTQTAQELLIVRRKRQRLVLGIGAVVVLAVVAIITSSKLDGLVRWPLETAQCVQVIPAEEAANLIKMVL
jgi:hypothetical protein